MTTPITTTTQLEALPEKTPIRDRMGDVGIVQAGKVHYPETAPQTFERVIKKYAPLTVLPAPTVKPGRDELARAMDPDARDDTVKKSSHPGAVVQWGLRRKVTLDHADAVLAILPGKSEAQVRAGALRDAKARIALDFTFSGHEVAAWLDARADEEAGK